METKKEATKLSKTRRHALFMILQVLVTVMFFAMIFALAEVFARIKTDRPLHNAYLAPRWLELLDSLPEKEQFIADRSAREIRKLKYHDFHLYSLAPYTSQTVTFTDFFSARRSPDSSPRSEASEIIWMFGGSTMQNLETTDELTIANQMAVRLKAFGVSANVQNFGTGSFQSSMELIKFQDLLRRVPPEMRPTYAVFYDGYNDAQCGYLFGRAA